MGQQGSPLHKSFNQSLFQNTLRVLIVDSKGKNLLISKLIAILRVLIVDSKGKNLLISKLIAI